MERWAKIRGSNDYSVSTHGRVRSDRYDRLLTPQLTRAGTLVAQYRIGKRDFGKQVAYLVAEAFLVGPTVHVKRLRYKDGDRTNCRLDNIEIVSWTLYDI